MSDIIEKEYENSNEFHQKLRYFNEMVGKIHSLLALEPGDIRATQDAERDLAAELVRYRAANDAVEQARVALELSEKMRSRAATQMRLIAHQGRALAQATIETVESRPHVRPMYKAGLRDIFAGAGDTAETFAAPSNGANTVELSPGTPRFMPVALTLTGDKAKPELRWQWNGAHSDTLRFEVSAAVGTVSTYRGTATATPGQEFILLGATEPGAEMAFPILLPNTPNRPVKDGVPVTYRVRAMLLGGAQSEWSEPLQVMWGQSSGVAPVSETPVAASAQNSVFSALFEFGTRRARG